MLALKDLMGDSSIGDSPISHSPFWTTSVDPISPAQLASFRARMALD
ncbi:hypothetical protein [Variovorax soli]|uniref:Uncharacterized protein n=1 Tax=Variovorax soli TaxID=376815 RepID=A0ABU1NLZ7_9BURK|nr:hypothetical protein [Variovorax soli]MDR6539480.1 hypothetical protein [Variovorax soli]